MTPPMLALLHRDLRVARRELPYFLLRVGLQPLLFTFIFGFVMPRLGIIQRGYTGMLLPGILGLSMTLSSMQAVALPLDRKSTRLNSSHQIISYAVFCLKKKKNINTRVDYNDRALYTY